MRAHSEADWTPAEVAGFRQHIARLEKENTRLLLIADAAEACVTPKGWSQEEALWRLESLLRGFKNG